VDEAGQDEAHIVFVDADPHEVLGETGMEVFEADPGSFPGFDSRRVARGGFSGVHRIIARFLACPEEDLDFLASLRDD
jgi:hypothetical protein